MIVDLRATSRPSQGEKGRESPRQELLLGSSRASSYGRGFIEKLRFSAK